MALTRQKAPISPAGREAAGGPALHRGEAFTASQQMHRGEGQAWQNRAARPAWAGAGRRRGPRAVAPATDVGSAGIATSRRSQTRLHSAAFSELPRAPPAALCRVCQVCRGEIGTCIYAPQRREGVVGTYLVHIHPRHSASPSGLRRPHPDSGRAITNVRASMPQYKVLNGAAGRGGLPGGGQRRKLRRERLEVRPMAPRAASRAF